MARMSHGGFARGLMGVLVLAGANFFPAAAQSADERPSRADYQIRARYDETQRRIGGEETIRWVNESKDDVPDLWFHLYWNAFKNEASTAFRESGGRGRGGEAFVACLLYTSPSPRDS